MGQHLTRREFLHTSLGGAVASLLGGCEPGTGTGRAPGGSRPPNVLFIVIDDLNDWVGCLGGHPNARTPHIDALARRGVLFTRAYCSSTLCNPSRTSVLTGLRPSTSGIYGNRRSWQHAPPSAIPIPQHFRANGYRVMGGGKIFHAYPGHPVWKQLPWSLARFAFGGVLGSWDDYFLERYDPPPAQLPANGIPTQTPQRGMFDWGALDVSDEQMGDWKLSEWVGRQLRRSYREPFFLACGFGKPHLPWYLPRARFESVRPEEVELPKVLPDDLADVPAWPRQFVHGLDLAPVVSDKRIWREAVAAYLACVSFVDVCVGRVIAALDESPHARDTIVVLWSDHGFHLGEKLHWRKGTMWEEATHVPLIVAAPGRTEATGRCPRTVSLLDVYPTLVELCGLSPRDGLEGTSLVRLLEDPGRTWERPAVTTGLAPGIHSVRTERWRYVRYADGGEELYDHDRDELEWRNLARDSGLAAVKAELARWIPTTNAPPA